MQDESWSISENSTWGIRRRFEQGKVTVNHTKFMGYDKDENGNLIIDEKQAKIVRRIFSNYLDGKGPNRIAKEFEDEGVKNWNGKSKWYESSIRKMLSNEKYKGDALLQKTYTVDFLSKKRVENNGEVPQYYVEESHPAIIDKEMWEAIQLEMERKRVYAEKQQIQKIDYATDQHPFAGRVICGCCGRAYGRKVWNSTDERLRRIIWRCNSKYGVKGEVGCESRHIDDKLLYSAFVNTFNAIVENIDYFMEKWKGQTEGKDILTKVTAKRFIANFQISQPIVRFDTELYFKLVERITVNENKLIVCLLDGTEIECEVE
ncbi:MAG TPA: recombinase family protein [Ruminiclostridium sp.]